MGCMQSSVGPKYEDYDWLELPIKARNAAETLGFTKKKWDKDKDPALCDEDWDDLTDEQRTAAAVLGYDKETWEADD
jgi:hypothetical protein